MDFSELVTSPTDNDKFDSSVEWTGFGISVIGYREAGAKAFGPQSGGVNSMFCEVPQDAFGPGFGEDK